MSACAVMLVKDEADIVGYTLRHLLTQVDEVIVADNMSTDGTAELIDALRHELPGLHYRVDEEVGYYQDRKTTRLAHLARELGHDWVVPCDADEYWYAPDGRRIADWLAGLAPDVAFASADLYDHVPSALDVAVEEEPNPFRRIGWRLREHGALGKVACRLLPGLEIRMGNHSAYLPGSGLAVSGLVIRHFTWRTVDQYVRKIRNGERAYAATSMHPSVGAHWRAFEGKPDEAVADHFRTWFWKLDPAADASLIYDPAPGA